MSPQNPNILLQNLEDIKRDYTKLLDEYLNVMPDALSYPSGSTISTATITSEGQNICTLTGNNYEKFKLLFQCIYNEQGKLFTLSERIKSRKDDNVSRLNANHEELQKINLERTAIMNKYKDNTNLSDAAIQSINDIKFNYNFNLLNSLLLLLFVFISAFTLIKKSRQNNLI